MYIRYMPTCNGCGNEFESKRSDARFCSTRCRVAAHRRRESQVDEFHRFCAGIDDAVSGLHLATYSPHFEKFSDGQRVLMAQKLREAADKIDASAVSPQ